MARSTIAKTAQLAQIYDIPVGTWSSWRSKGIGPKYAKIGNEVVYLLSDVDSFMSNHKLKRIRSRAGRILAYKQGELLPAQENETVEVKTGTGETEKYKTLPLDPLPAYPPPADPNFTNMARTQIEAIRSLFPGIKVSEAGRAYLSQLQTTIEVLFAWCDKLEGAINHE